MSEPTQPQAESSSASASNPPAAPSPRRWMTHLLLAGGFLTSLTVLGAAWHRHRGVPPAAAAMAPAPPFVTKPLPAAPPQAPAPTPTPAIAKAPVRRPQVELVFALDTTGSMSGLIEGAKRKIWSLASFVAQGQPTPELRVGLVGYRDVGDTYVTKVFDLDGDLDRVYRRLSSFEAGGGGDSPEHVARALDESVRKMSWSKAQEVVKVIYLVGDAPPHEDYNDGYDLEKAAHAAAHAGIAVHTIQCGTDSATAQAWRTVASLGHGDFMTIEQSGGMHEEHSKYDDELARLHDRLAGTTIAWGVHKSEVESSNRAALEAPASVKAARAGYMGWNKRAVAGDGDLLESVGSGSVELEKIQAELPSELRAKPLAAQKAEIAAKQKERDEINQRIEGLSKLRQQELDARERDAAKEGRRDGFDVAAKKALRRSVKANAAAAFEL